ncbi:MAG: AAA family ATPase [Desulfuromonas sp.]|nr:AAA family ATPase [Desulfuromonas sp.]
MYKDYFGLKDKPFSISPDPHYLYMSERHREALAHLIYALQTDGGFILLTGEVGTGKTTVCRCLLEQIPEDTEIALVLNPKLTAVELLATICDELKIDYPQHNTSIKVFIDGINNYLLTAHASGHRTVLIIDEAQNLSIDVLEQLRLLTNLETNKRKLLQVILLGQPELQTILAKPELRQLSQRITARYHLNPLSRTEVASYINHRLSVAGIERPLFPRASINKLYRLSAGVPRIINLLCDRALLGAYVKGVSTVKPRLLAATAREVFGEQHKIAQKSSSPHPKQNWRLAIALSAIVGIAIWLVLDGTSSVQKSTTLQETPPTANTITPSEQPAKPRGGVIWPQQLALTDSLALAHHELFSQWGYDFPAQGILAGDYAQQNGLRYLSMRGSLGTLRSLNRPAILSLTNEQEQRFYATLIALDNDRATFACADAVQSVDTSELIDQWQGEFALLWQPPPTYTGAVQPGNNGPMLAWIEETFAQVNLRTPKQNQALKLEGQLLDEVKQFQAAHSLQADGIVGPITIIQLNNELSTNHPQLIKQEG